MPRAPLHDIGFRPPIQAPTVRHAPDRALSRVDVSNRDLGDKASRYDTERLYHLRPEAPAATGQQKPREFSATMGGSSAIITKPTHIKEGPEPYHIASPPHRRSKYPVTKARNERSSPASIASSPVSLPDIGRPTPQKPPTSCANFGGERQLVARRLQLLFSYNVGTLLGLIFPSRS